MKPRLLAVVVLILFALTLRGAGGPTATPGRTLMDIVWVWGIPVGSGVYEMGKGKMLATTDPAKFAQADVQSKASILGVRNVVMAGDGLPNDLKLAEELTSEVAQMKHLVWEMTPDNGQGPPFVYKEKLAILKTLKARYPQIEAISIDDMLTSQRKKGLRPENIATLRRELHASVPGVKMWGIVYTKNLDDPLLPLFLKSIDVVNLWTWRQTQSMTWSRTSRRRKNSPAEGQSC